MISIIIPVLNEHEMTRECVSSIIENTNDYEIVLIDNGSNESYYRSFGSTNVILIHNEKNLGFPVAVNQGILASKGEIICLLNNDVIVTPGWTEKLASHLDKYAIVGPMTNFSSGAQQTGIPVYYDKGELYSVVESWSKDRRGMTLSMKWVLGFCFMFKRSLYDELGPFDESIWPSSGEEIDFCCRVRKAGHKVGIIQDVYVHHEGSATFKQMSNYCDYGQLIEKTSKHLIERWGNDVIRQNIPIGRENGDGLRLNLGCGKFKMNGFINIDQLDRVQPDLLADVLHLPYDLGTVSEIYAGHILEHFSFADGMKALYYWHSLLKDGGIISISVPNYDTIVDQYIAEPTADKLIELNDLYIYSQLQESPHRYCYSEDLLKKVMIDAGFIDLKRMPIDHQYFPFPVDWQVGYEGRKT